MATVAIMPDVPRWLDDYIIRNYIEVELRGNEKSEGLFIFRELLKIIYLRKKHYFPTKPSEFNLLPGHF